LPLLKFEPSYMMRHAVSCYSSEETYFCCCSLCHFVPTCSVNVQRSVPYASSGVAVTSYSCHRFDYGIYDVSTVSSYRANVPVCLILVLLLCLFAEYTEIMKTACIPKCIAKNSCCSHNSLIRMQNVRYRRNIFVFMSLSRV